MPPDFGGWLNIFVPREYGLCTFYSGGSLFCGSLAVFCLDTHCWECNVLVLHSSFISQSHARGVMMSLVRICALDVLVPS